MSLPAHVASGLRKAVCLLAFCLLVITSNGAFAQDAPTGLTATASPGQVTLSWTAANFPTEFSTINGAPMPNSTGSIAPLRLEMKLATRSRR